MKNPILKKIVYDLSIEDFLNGCPLQILIILFKALGDEPQIVKKKSQWKFI